MSESKPTYQELEERIRELEDSVIKKRRAEARMQILNKRFADSLKARDEIARKLSALHSMVDMPELYLDADWNVVGYSTDFLFLTNKVEEFVREKKNVREFLREGDFGQISGYREQLERLKELDFDKGREWQLRYKGPDSSDRIAQDWIVHSNCRENRWKIIEKGKKLRIVHKPHIHNEVDCYLVSTREFGGADEDLKITYKVRTSKKEENIRELSLVLTEASGREEISPDSLGYTACSGANCNSEGRLQRRNANVVSIPEVLEPDSEYQIAVERTGGRLRRLLRNTRTGDKAPVLEMIDTNAIYGHQKHIGFTTFSGEMEIYDIEVYTRKSLFSVEQFKVIFDFEAGIRDRKLKDRLFKLRLGITAPSGKLLYTLMFEDIRGQKRMAEALRENIERFKELYEEAPVGYHEIDRQGRIIRVNNTEAALLGYSPEEMVGKFVWEFMPGDQRKDSKESVRDKVARGKTIKEFERIYVCRNGKLIDAYITDRLNLDEDGKVITIRSTLQDITQRKRAEEALRKGEKHYRNVIENIIKFVPEGLLVFSNRLNLIKKNKAIQDMLQNYATKLNYTEEELMDIIVEQVKSRIIKGAHSEIRITRKKD